jgi:hypothetical protein
MLEPSKSKLYLVKALKDVTGLGLREAKDLIDDLHSGREVKTVVSSREGVIELKSRFNEHGKFIINGGIEYQRNIQLLQLELGESDEYINEISDRIFYQLDDENSKLLLNFALSKLSHQQLIEIFTESNSFING